MLRPFALFVLLSACAAPREDLGDAPETDAPFDAPDAPDARVDAAVPGFRRETPLPHPLQEITATTDGDRIVIAGGIDETVAVVSEVWAFDGATWSALPALPEPRHHATLLSRDGTLYLLGGMASLRFEPLDTVFALAPGATAWERRAPLPRPLAAAVGAWVSGELILAGGQTDRGLATSVIRGDPETGAYRAGAAPPVPSEHLAGFARDGEVWVTGGRDFQPRLSTDAVQVYDVARDTWRMEPPLAGPRGGHSATRLVLEGTEHLFIAGGELEGLALDDYERLGADATGSLPTARHGHAAAVLGDRIYLIGGADRPLFGAIASVESWAP